MRDRGRGNPLLVEGKGVDAGTGWADAQLVPLAQAELVGEGRETVGKCLRRGHQLQLVAVRDAVEVDTGLDSAELARDLRVEDPRTRADAADLRGREGDEDQRAHVAVAGESVGDPANALDAGRVVDDAGAPPDGVVVSGDDDRFVALAAKLGDDVPLRDAGDETPADSDACTGAFALP